MHFVLLFATRLVELKPDIVAVGETLVTLLIAAYLVYSTYKHLFGKPKQPKEPTVNIKDLEKLIVAVGRILDTKRPAKDHHRIKRIAPKPEPDEAPKKIIG
jgi:hypothetical protein